MNESSPAGSGATALYTHHTDFHDANGPRFEIASLKMPELRMRTPKPDDATALLFLFSDQRNVQYDKSCDGLDNPEAIDALITQWRTFKRPLDRANAVIEIEGDTVGTAGLGWIGKKESDGTSIADAGIMLDPRFRGKGYAYEALRIAIDHGFRVLGMDEISVACVDANMPLKGLMNSKFGFTASPIRHEQWGNEWIWRVTKKQWYESRHSK